MKILKVVIFLMVVLPMTSLAKSILKEDICKASIATIMGRDITIMNIDVIKEDSVYLSYIRSDGTRWSYKCKLNGNKVVWGNADGRWRTEDIVTYTIFDEIVTINDESTSSTKSFSFE